MSKSVELLAGSEDSEPIPTSNTIAQERSRLNLNGSRQLSKSATELRDSEIANSSPSRRGDGSGESGIIHHHRHHRHHGTVAQRTHTFFATLKSRWTRSRSKERKKSKDASSVQSQDAGQLKNLGVESDYAADYSSEHSRSSSATQSPARHCLNRPESPLARSSREKTVTVQEDNSGKCGEGFSKGSVSFQREGHTGEEPQGSFRQDGDFLQDEMIRKREQALRQHAFFQLRLHIRRGANLVAMDRCGASDPYVKVKCSGRLLHKSRTVHRDLNPVWDESVTLPIEDPFQPLTIKVFDYDWGLQDDFMGAALLELTQLDLGHSQDITLELKDPVRPKQHLGEIYLTATLWPRNQQEKEQFFRSSLNISEVDVTTRLKLKKIAIDKICKINMQRENTNETALVASKMDPESKIDLLSKLNVASEIDTVPKIEVTSEINATSKNVVAAETVAMSGKNSVDDVSKIDAASEIYVVSNADTVSKKIDEVSIDKSSDIGEPSRGLHRNKPYEDQREKRHSIAVLDRFISKQKFEKDFAEVKCDAAVSTTSVLGSDGNFCGNIRVEENSRELNSVAGEKSRIQSTFAVTELPKIKQVEGLSVKATSEIIEERSSAIESEKPKLEEASAMIEIWKTRVSEGPSTENLSGIKKQKTKDSLRSSLRRKVDLIERILEDQVERIWEENVEKHTWLQPIETWITDHRRPSTYTLTHCQLDTDTTDNLTDINQDIVSEPTYDFKFTPAREEDEEPKIESKLMENRRTAKIDEQKTENKIIEHWRRLRNRDASPKSDRFESASLITQLNNQEIVSSDAGNVEDNANVSNDSGVLEVKEIKRHDLLDRLKDNVKGKMEDIHRYFQRTNRLADVNRRLKSQIWSSVVTIVLVEAKNLLPMDIDGLSDPYVKFRLGTEKYKSKVVNKTLNPIWLEQFDLHLYEDPYLGQELEVTVWDRDRSHQDDLMGKTVIDLATLERETTHRLWRELEDGSGNIFLLLTISGTTASETISDLAMHEETPVEQAQLVQRYSVTNTLQRIRDVGHLTIKVYRAQGLAAADLGGKSDPFCVLELVNSRLQTQTEYKTLTPNWQKIFTFNVKDINSVLEVTVYDEDRDHKVEFLGRVAIPLLKIRNGEKRWYVLKDKKLRGRAKGNCPQILLEMTVIWNILRACIRTLNPKEKKYMEPEVKFKRQVFLRNVLRLKAIIVIFIDIGKYIQSCWEWESKMRSIFALVIFILGCYYFEPYMIPGVALLILVKYYLLSGERSGFNHWICGQVAVITGAPLVYATSQFQDHAEIGSDDCPPTPGDDDDDDDDKDKEEKKSLKERLQAIQEVTQTVQNSIGYIASLCEKVKNLFNFTIPYLSYLAMLLAIAGAVVLYFIPVRYLILAWGVNKFSRKILRPHSVPNNEVLDLISRVPDDEELLNYRELKPVPTADCERGGSSGSPSSNAARREQRKRHKAA
ncbi:PREDICTED: multiple C2 and transmembrane domain-containing protein 1 [Cyphomyrmex costatus]|uniref:multiple C2 and transmembrane domain-containing protein 1 n=1 Tax=Cyphomyrmex costatus TaxID=456900 RepID=UPI00085242BD|nr:PREDICTED: multiple C2 and transmembrane domain-containing protein 1 [Cyphomyrmex costatus]